MGWLGTGTSLPYDTSVAMVDVACPFMMTIPSCNPSKSASFCWILWLSVMHLMLFYGLLHALTSLVK